MISAMVFKLIWDFDGTRNDVTNQNTVTFKFQQE